MNQTPISLIVDDSAPGVHVYWHHIESHCTKDGRPLAKYVPNEFLYAFCDLIEEYGMGGKFSVVPMPGGQGCVNTGIEGVADEQRAAWLDAVRLRVMPRFDLCPEILTHANALDLDSGTFLPLNEMAWASSQTRRTLTPYIAKAIRLLDEANLAPTGVTSPWMFGEDVEAEYQAAISQAFSETHGAKNAWYFLHCYSGRTDVRPQVVLNEGGRHLVSVSATFRDHFWASIDNPDASDAFAREIADQYLSEDGASGELLRQVEAGCPAVLLSHWQSLYGNGSLVGLRALRMVCERVRTHLSGRVRWVNFSTLMNEALAKMS